MSSRNAISGLVLASLCCALIYSFGLPGGFMFDDYPNLETVSRFLDGKLEIRGVLFSNTSGSFGRIIPMATFLANAVTTGMEAGPMKITNLLIHLGCGLLIAVLLAAVIRRDKIAPTQARMWACVIAAIWLVLPINVSTVLYIVQRMAQLSALFVLAGLIIYMKARSEWEQHLVRSRILLWLGVPFFTALALFSKENGALLPLLALVLEVTLFTTASGTSARRHVLAFYGITLVLPLFGVLLLASFGHGLNHLDYSSRNFTLSQRLLTEPSVLWSYLRNILIPFNASLGLTHDDYPLTRTLYSLRPWMAIGGWAIAVLLAWRMFRAGERLVLAGILFFLAGHAMESTIFPLEIYFEHRNYLPEIGVLLAVFGLFRKLLSFLPATTLLFRRSLAILGLLLFATYAGATAVRALVWQNTDTLMRASILAHPNSARMNFQYGGLMLDEQQYEQALFYMDRAAALLPEDATAILLGKVSVYCQQGIDVPQSLVQQLVSTPPQRFVQPGDLAYEAMTKFVGDGKCGSFGPGDAAAIGVAWIEGDRSGKAFAADWRFQHYTALNLSRSGQWHEAIPYSEAAWRLSGHQLQSGLLLFQIYDAVGNLSACRDLLDELKQRDDGSEIEAHQAIESFAQYLDPLHQG